MEKGDIVTVKSHVHSGYAMPYADKLDLTADELAQACNTATAVHVPEGGENKPTSRCLWRTELPEPVKCMVVGWATRQTGFRNTEGGYYDGDPPDWVEEDVSLAADKYHKVTMCQPLTTNQWHKPFACMDEDFVEVE